MPAPRLRVDGGTVTSTLTSSGSPGWTAAKPEPTIAPFSRASRSACASNARLYDCTSGSAKRMCGQVALKTSSESCSSTSSATGETSIMQLQYDDNIWGRPGFDVVVTPAELQAEVPGRPPKTTGTQRKCEEHTRTRSRCLISS